MGSPIPNSLFRSFKNNFTKNFKFGSKSEKFGNSKLVKPCRKKLGIQMRLSCSWHPTTKQPILFPPIFSMIFPQFEQLKKKTNFYLVQNLEKTCFGPTKSFFSFSTAKTEKKSWKKLVKIRLVVWWFDVTNNIIDHF